MKYIERGEYFYLFDFLWNKNWDLQNFYMKDLCQYLRNNFMLFRLRINQPILCLMTIRFPKGAPVPKSAAWRLSNKKIKLPPLGTIGVIVCTTLIAGAFYAVGIQPKVNHEYYQEKQEKNFAKMNLSKEERARGLRPWSDPFDRESKK